MDKRKNAAFALTILMVLTGASVSVAEAQYTARDKNGQIVKQGTTTENEEFYVFDGLEYEINGEHRTNKGENWAAYVLANGTKARINGNVVNLKGGTSIEVDEQSLAVIQGNLYGDVRNFDSTLEIHGDVESESWLGAIVALGEVGNKVGHKTQTTVIGNIKSAERGVLAQDGGHIKIVGNIEAGTNGVVVGDLNDSDGVDGAAVEVQGNITAQENGIIVYQPNPEKNRWNDTFCVKVQGDVQGGMCGIDTYGITIIDGNVKSEWSGVCLENDANVWISGNVYTTGEDTDYSDLEYYKENGIWPVYGGHAIESAFEEGKDAGEINVEGNIEATGDGIRMVNGKANVLGNVSSKYASAIEADSALPVSITVGGNADGNIRCSTIWINISFENQIIVKGMTNAYGKQSAIEIYDDGTVDATRTNTPKNLPTILVKTLNVESGDYFKALTHDENGEEIESKDLAEATAKATWYIVDINQPTNGKIEVRGTSAKEGLLVAHEGDKLTVTGTPKKGYRLTGIDAGSKALVTENEDGTYTVTVERGGDVTISASFEAMPEMPQTGDETPLKETVVVLAGSLSLLVVLWKKRESA